MTADMLDEWSAKFKAHVPGSSMKTDPRPTRSTTLKIDAQKTCKLNLTMDSGVHKKYADQPLSAGSESNIKYLRVWKILWHTETSLATRF